MRRGRAWLGVAVAVVVFWSGPLPAEEAEPPASAAQGGATEAACTAACQGVIARCTGVFGPAMGDMRPFCARAVVRRCRAMGVTVCESAAGTR